MTAFTGCILLLALLLKGVSDSASRKMVNGNENLQIRAGNILKLYNRHIHRCNNHAAHKSVMFNSEGEELGIAKKPKRDVHMGKSGLTYQERIDLLVAHNHWRRVVDNPQASNIIHMVWSLELEKIALSWASKCRYDEGFADDIPDEYKHPDVGIGQNIWSRIGSYNVEAAIKDFYNEKMVDTSTNQLLCNQVDKCRHYKQVVWAESIYLGCAIVHCPTYLARDRMDKDVFNLVCNYSPAGNRLSAGGVPAQPFRIGQPGTQCPPAHPKVENGLCRTNPPCNDVKECDTLRSNTTTCLCDHSYYEESEASKSKQDENSETYANIKTCCSVKLTVSSINLSCTVFVAFVVTYALSLESAS